MSVPAPFAIQSCLRINGFSQIYFLYFAMDSTLPEFQLKRELLKLNFRTETCAACSDSIYFIALGYLQ